MRKLILLVVVCSSLYFGSGCMDSTLYNQPRDSQWLTEQLQKEKITQDQYKSLIPKIAE